MKVKQVYMWERGEVLAAKATVDVAGLGDVQFDCELSYEVVERIKAEVIAQLRIRLGQPI